MGSYMTNLPDRILDAFFQINARMAALPDVHLLPGDRQLLGGHLQPGAPRIVELVARALSFAPDLYREVPVSGAELAGRQAEADAWLRLRDLLLGWAQLAADHHLAAQSDAVQTAGLIIDHLCRGPVPLLPEQQERRTRQQEGLWPALLLLNRVRGRRSSGRRPSPLLRQRSRALLQRAYECTRHRLLRALPEGQEKEKETGRPCQPAGRAETDL